MSRTVVVPGGAGLGAVAGAVGGLGFGAAMIELGLLESIASLVRAQSPVLGFIIHLAIAALIGSGFGMLVWHQRPAAGEIVLWGLAYGAAWWFIGAVTLLPLLSGQPVAWDVDAARELLPALIGHLVYGIVTGVVLVVLRRGDDPTGHAFRVDRRALIRGGIAGLFGGLILGVTLDSQTGLPAISAE